MPTRPPSDKVRNNTSGSNCYADYQERTTLLSEQLQAIEDKLQFMPVSDCKKILDNENGHEYGLAIERLDNRWILVHTTEWEEYVHIEEDSFRVIATGIRSRHNTERRTSRKPLTSCSVKQKAWAAKHLASFLVFALKHHRDRMESVQAANRS
ncbi:MAG: hypothetical protein ACIAQ0_10255, partial [Phycisphaerales bacterium JB058]